MSLTSTREVLLPAPPCTERRGGRREVMQTEARSSEKRVAGLWKGRENSGDDEVSPPKPPTNIPQKAKADTEVMVTPGHVSPSDSLARSAALPMGR